MSMNQKTISCMGLCAAAILFAVAAPRMEACAATILNNAAYVPAETTGPGVAKAEWQQDERGYWYRHSDGSYTKDAWEEIDGVWYHFDGEGYMQADCWVDGEGGVRYRLGADGGMLVSQDITVDGVTYTLDENGAATAQTPAKTENELAAEAYAARIVAQITNDSMSKPQKAEAIYNWVRGNMSYTSSGPKSDEAYSALYGFRRRSGCCYEYYAMSHYMLEAAGMPNIPVVRASDGDHFWNLVNVDGTWLHFDATPRSSGGRWCLVPTSTLRRTWGAHNFDVAAYPQTP